MSPIRHTGRHRKPRRSRVTKLFHGGVLSGVLSTVAVAAPAGAAPPAGPPEEPPAESTGEIPVLHGLLTTSAAQAAEATERYAVATDVQQAQQRALRAAEQAAAERKAEEEAAAEAAAAEAEAEAEAAAAAREAEAAAAAASRSTDRADSLAADSGDSGEASGDSANTTASAPAPASGSAVVDFARSQVGAAYQLGANGPSAWDCSSLTQAAYAAAGVSLPRTSQEQSTAGTQIPVSEAQPGDLLYWGGAGSAHHVAIYAGNGRFIGAQNPSTGVVEQDLSWSQPTGAIRVG